MLVTRRVVYYGAISLATFVVLCAAIVKTLGISPWGRMVVAPASLDGTVTISMSTDNTLTFITCAPYHPALLRRLFHSILSCAFVVQHRGATPNAVAHAGNAHIEFQDDLLSVVFADSSRFVFTTAPTGYIPPGEAKWTIQLASRPTA